MEKIKEILANMNDICDRYLVSDHEKVAQLNNQAELLREAIDRELETW